MVVIENSFEILAVSLTVIEIVLILLRSFVSPVNVIVLYWYLWQFVSVASSDVLFVPSLEVYLFHIVFIASFVVGSIVSRVKLMPSTDYRAINHGCLFDGVMLRKVSGILFWFFILILPYTLYLFVSAISLVSSGYSGLRGSLVSMDNNPLFNSVLLNYFYYVILNGLWTFYALFAGATFFLLNQKRHMIMVILFSILISGVYFSRAYLYYFFIIISWSYMLFKMKDRAISRRLLSSIVKDVFVNKRVRIFALIIIVLITALQIQSVLRAESGGKSTENIFYSTLIKYHVAGFVLFDLELQDESSALNSKPTYGLGIFGGVERFVALLIKQVDRDYKSLVARDSLSEFRVIGIDENGTNIRSNALYNIVYTLVRDGGYFALILVGVVLGYSANSFFRNWRNNSSYYSYIWAIFLFSLLTTSFLRSNLESTSYWICIMLLLISPYLNRLTYKKQRTLSNTGV